MSNKQLYELTEDNSKMLFNFIESLTTPRYFTRSLLNKYQNGKTLREVAVALKVSLKKEFSIRDENFNIIDVKFDLVGDKLFFSVEVD